MEIRFDIPHEPVPASRPRVMPRGGVFYPKAHTAYAKTLETELQNLPKAPTGRSVVEVRLLFVMPPYKTSDYPVHRADVDNLAKLPMDAITKSVEKSDAGTVTCRYWEDDNLVGLLMASKVFARDDEKPHTKVFIKTIDEDPNDYLRRRFLEP